MELKKVEEGVIPIYENETRERLINARELHRTLKILLKDVFKVSLETDKKTRKKMVVIRELEEGRSLKDA